MHSINNPYLYNYVCQAYENACSLFIFFYISPLFEYTRPVGIGVARGGGGEGGGGACPPNNLHKYAPPPPPPQKKKKLKKMVCHFKKNYVCPQSVIAFYVCPPPPPPICNCFLRACIHRGSYAVKACLINFI